MKPLYLASYDSRNFTFEGVGETESEAVAVLIQGLRVHARRYWWYESDMRAAADAGKPESVVEDPARLIGDAVFTVRRLDRGAAYRDREEIRESGK